MCVLVLQGGYQKILCITNEKYNATSKGKAIRKCDPSEARSLEVVKLDVQLEHNPGYPQSSSTKALIFKTSEALLN